MSNTSETTPPLPVRWTRKSVEEAMQVDVQHSPSNNDKPCDPLVRKSDLHKPSDYRFNHVGSSHCNAYTGR